MTRPETLLVKVTWDIEYDMDDIKRMRDFEKAVNHLSRRNIAFSIVVSERLAYWSQELPTPSVHIPLSNHRLLIDQIAQVMAGRYGVTMTYPRLASAKGFSSPLQD